MNHVVLAIDKDRFLCTLLERTLDPFLEIDVLLVTATSASEASVLFQRHEPHLVLLDLALPNRASRELARLFREASPETPIVGLVDKGAEPNEGLLEFEIDAIVTKPFDPEAVQVLVGRYLGIEVDF